MNIRLSVSFSAPLRAVVVSAVPVASLLFGLTYPAAASAQGAPSASNPAPSAQTPDAAVRSAVEGTLTAINADPAALGGDQSKTVELVQRKFLPYADFRRTARLATGDAWKTATPQQQEQIFQQFQTLMVRTYAAQLSQAGGQNIKFNVKGAAAAAGTDAVVQTVVHTDGDDMPIGYRLGKTATGWKIYDIDMMGAWLIQIYRTQFAEQIQRGGVDGLIKFLAAHNGAGAG